MTNPQGSGAAEILEFGDDAVLPHNPDVSVLLMAYNHSRYLNQSIASVLEQCTDFSFELIVGEDGSSDSSLAIALDFQRRYPHIVRVVTPTTNTGAYRNYRRLLARARGRFVAHLDGDDFWFPEKLQRQVMHLLNSPQHAAVYSDAITVNENDDRMGVFNGLGTKEIDLAYLFRHGNFLNMSSMMFRSQFRDTLLAIESPFIDYETHLRLAQVGPLLQLGEVLCAYRVNSSSSMLSASQDGVRDLYWQAICSVPPHLLSHSDRAKGLADFLRRIVFAAFRSRRAELLRRWTPKVVLSSPYGTVRTLLLVVNAVLRHAWRVGLRRRVRVDNGSSQYVLYRR